MHQGRLRLRSWLEEQIKSGRYPGVVWLDEIPWKHAARHGWNIETDATLFRNWAIHTGRYKPGTDKPDPKTWKANFRCALNSLPDVKELQDKSIKKGHNAFKVYVLLPQSKSPKRRRGLRSFDTDIVSGSSPSQRNTALERFTEAFWMFAEDRGRSTAEVFRKDHLSKDVDEEISTLYCCSSAVGTTKQGQQMSSTEEKEQTEAVVKIADHLKNLEYWSPLYDSDRSGIPSSTWMECLCYTYPPDSNIYKISSDQ